MSALADGLTVEFELQQVFLSLQDSLSILAVLNIAVVWMVSTRPPTFKSSSPFINLLVTLPKAPISICTYPSFHILSVLVCGQPDYYYYYYYYYLYYSLFRAFHISVSR